MKKQLFILILALTLVFSIFPMVSASLSITTATDYEKGKFGYPEITLNDWFGLPLISEEIFKGTIEEHTVNCASNCESIIKVLVKEGLPYYDSIKFYKLNDGKRIEKQVYNSKVEIRTEHKLVVVPVYEYVCEGGGDGTKGEKCENVQTGTIDTYKDSWSEINSETLSDGKEAYIRVSGSKKSSDIIDWVITTNGESLDSWAVWGANLDVGLKGYWRFNETSGTNYAAIFGGSTLSLADSHIAGIIGNAHKFASGTVDASSGINVDTNSFSISAWVKDVPTSTYPVGNDEDGSTGGDWRWVSQANAMTFYVTDSASEKNTGSAALNSSGFSHIVMLVNSSSVIMYADNVKKVETALTNYAKNDKEMFFGGGTAPPNNLILDEFAYYNRSLTVSEISELYNSGLGLNYGAGEFTITLNSPANGYSTITSPISFNCSANPVNPATVTNRSIWTNKTGTWEISNTSTTNGELISVGFSNGNYNWTCGACDSDGTCIISGENRTLNKGDTQVNSVSYNASTYETSSETYSINASGILTSANLVYSGTSYAATVSGDTATATIIVPASIGNKSFYWSLNSGATLSSTYYQNVKGIQFSLCNSSNTQLFLNVTFKDETTGTLINATASTSFVYGISQGLKTYTYSTTTQNYNYSFCFLGGNNQTIVTPTIQYAATGYPSRTYNPSQQNYSNTATHLLLALLGSGEGIYTTIQVINTALAQISGAQMYVSNANGLNVSGITDSAGTITWFLNPNLLHDFIVSKTGYTTFTTSLTPTQSTYTFTMGSTSTTATNYTTDTTTYSIKPSDNYLNNDTTYAFNVTWASSTFTFTGYGFNITNEDNVRVATTSGTTATGETLNVNVNTGSNQTFTLTGYYIIDGVTSTFNKVYTISDTTGSEFSIAQFGRYLLTYVGGTGMFGLKARSFSMNLIIFFIIFITVGIVSWKFGLYSPMVIAGLIFILVAIFDWGLGLILNPAGAVGHFATFFTLLILIGVIIKEVAGY